MHALFVVPEFEGIAGGTPAAKHWFKGSRRRYDGDILVAEFVLGLRI